MIFDALLGIVNKFIPDQDKAKQLALEMEQEYTKQVKMQSDIIQQEAINGSGKWRVRLMYLCMVMVGCHFLMYDVIPYIRTVFDLNFWTPQAPIDENLWSFLEIGVGGYIVSRSAEKVTKHFRGK